MKLTKEQEKILEVLADERKINPTTSLTGIDMKLLGEKVGAYLGIGVMYDVAKLKDLGFVSRKRNNVIITQKGLDYVSSYRPLNRSSSIENSTNRPPTRSSNIENNTKMWVLISLLIAVVGGLIVAFITGWRPW